MRCAASSTAQSDLERDEPAVGVLADHVQLDRALQHGNGSFDTAGIGMEHGEPDVGIEGAAVQILTDRLDPQRVPIRIEVAPIGRTCRFEGDNGFSRRSCTGGLAESVLEAPQIDVED